MQILKFCFCISWQLTRNNEPSVSNCEKHRTTFIIHDARFWGDLNGQSGCMSSTTTNRVENFTLCWKICNFVLLYIIIICIIMQGLRQVMMHSSLGENKFNYCYALIRQINYAIYSFMHYFAYQKGTR